MAYGFCSLIGMLIENYQRLCTRNQRTKTGNTFIKDRDERHFFLVGIGK